MYRCEEFAHRHETQRSHNFDDQAEGGVYMGRADGMHRVYIPRNQKILGRSMWSSTRTFSSASTTQDVRAN